MLFLSGIILVVDVLSADLAEQMSNIASAPMKAGAGLSLVTVSYVFLAFGFFTIAAKSYQTRPRSAVWGAGLSISALFALTFFLGLEHVQRQAAGLPNGVDLVTTLDKINPLTPAFLAPLLAVLGFPLMAFAAWRAKVIPWWGAAGLPMFLLLPIGVIGGIPVAALLAGVGVAAACLPLGLRLWSAAS